VHEDIPWSSGWDTVCFILNVGGRQARMLIWFGLLTLLIDEKSLLQKLWRKVFLLSDAAEAIAD
jgi:hypothetical protein